MHDKSHDSPHPTNTKPCPRFLVPIFLIVPYRYICQLLAHARSTKNNHSSLSHSSANIIHLMPQRHALSLCIRHHTLRLPFSSLLIVGSHPTLFSPHQSKHYWMYLHLRPSSTLHPQIPVSSTPGHIPSGNCPVIPFGLTKLDITHRHHDPGTAAYSSLGRAPRMEYWPPAPAKTILRSLMAVLSMRVGTSMSSVVPWPVW